MTLRRHSVKDQQKKPLHKEGALFLLNFTSLNKPRFFQAVVAARHLSGFGNLAGLDTLGANSHFNFLAVNLGANLLQIGVETTFVNVMRMAYVIAGHGFFTANLT